MMRLIGIVSTLTVIFMLGFGVGTYTVGGFAYKVGARDAFRRCLEMSGGKLDVAEKENTDASRQFRCGTALLLIDGLAD